MMKVSDVKSSAVAVISASVSSLCCLLPLVVVVLGLGSGAFMAVTMKYSSIFIPAGILGTGTGYYLYFRERRRCHRLACRMVGGRLNLILLVLSALVLGVSVTLTALPDYTAHLIASWGGTAPMEDGMSGPAGHGVGGRAVSAPPSSGESGAIVPVARVTLHVDGMT